MIGDRGQDVSGSTPSGVGGWRAGLPAQPVGHVPGQEFVDAIDLVVSDMSQHEIQIGARIDAVKFAAPSQRIHRGDGPVPGTDEPECQATLSSSDLPTAA